MTLLSPPAGDEVCDALVDDPWLGALIGKPALRVRAGVDLTDPAFAGALAATLRCPALVTMKVPTTAIAVLQWLAPLGFGVVDVNMQLTREGDFRKSGPPKLRNGTIRLAQPDDEKMAAHIARHAFRYDRFHLDPRIPTEIADDIKEAWARNYFTGQRGDAMVVAEVDRSLAGFLLLLVDPQHGTTIDLIAVDPERQGEGLAIAMIQFAAMFEPRRFIVGTQASNVASLRLYEKIGFRATASNYVLHAHGGK